ncbi:bifunctional tetrahydrofolate synthase/dihydrofolate synthase [Thalassotalea fusca]
MTHEIQSHSQDKSLDEWLSYLESIHAVEIDLGLARISQVAERLAIDLSFSKVITVAGTNGKGTTCAFLENVLLSMQHSVAVYSSPHIERFNERLRLNKANVEDMPLVSAFEQIEQARGDISLTYYEYTTLAAMLVMMAQQPEYIILEVGLGGRLDATNLIDANIAVITTVDLDHQAFLGTDRESIGFEKAGIFRAKGIAVIGDLSPPNSVISHGEQLQATMLVRQRDFDVAIDENLAVWQWHGGDIVFDELPMPHIPLDNVATAIQVLRSLKLPINKEILASSIASTSVDGRTELFTTSTCDVMLDVGHNPLAARYLANVIANAPYDKVHAVFSLLADKDLPNTIEPLLPYIASWNVAKLDCPRTRTAEEMLSVMNPLGANVNCFDNIEDAYRMTVNQAGTRDLVLVFGSFFTVSAIRKLLV